MNLNITGKIIDTRPIQDLLRQGEKGVDTVSMIADRYYGSNNIDLGSLAWEIWGSYSDQDATATLPVSFEYTDDKITFSVTLNEYFTIYPGAETITLVGTDSNGTQVLKLTGSVAIIVQENERKTSSILVPSQVSNIEQAVADCLNAAQTASESASQAAIDAATASAAAAQVTSLTDRLTAVEGVASGAATAAATAQATADGKVSKAGDTMSGSLGIGKSSATDTNDGCYAGNNGTMYFRRTSGNPFLAFYKGSGDKRQILQGTDVSEDAYLTLPTTGGTIALTTDITARVYAVNSTTGSSLTISMTGYGAIAIFATRSGNNFVFTGNSFINNGTIQSTLSGMSATMSSGNCVVTNSTGATIKLLVIKG